jgi:uncharacterized protein YhfF
VTGRNTLWDDYVAAHPEHADEVPAVGPFGDSPAMADRLLDYVLHGPKRATCGLPDPDEPVVVGGHWVVQDGSGRSRVVLRTTDVRTGRLDSVDDAFAWDEGEDDRTRDSWLREHRVYVARGLGLAPGTDVDHVEVVFERFAVVWPPGHAD